MMTAKVGIFIGAAVVLLVAAAASGAMRGTSRPSVAPIAFSNRVAPSAVVSPTAALATAMTRMSRGTVTAARVGAPPKSIERRDTPWLYAEVAVPAMHDGLDIEPMWEA